MTNEIFIVKYCHHLHLRDSSAERQHYLIRTPLTLSTHNSPDQDEKGGLSETHDMQPDIANSK